MLREVATSVGLDPSRVEEVLAGDEYADAVAADIRQAAAYGATGVPFYVVAGKYGLSGAQPSEVFAQALSQAWSETQPSIQTIGGDDAAACGPDGCAL